MKREYGDFWIKLYNLYTVFMMPAVFFIGGIWILETKGGGPAPILPLGALGIFIPVVIFGLKWELSPKFTIACSIVWFFPLWGAAHYFCTVATNTPITYGGVMFILLTGTLWSVIIELNEDLRKHLLMFPQDQWLSPCISDGLFFQYCRLIGLTLFYVSIVFFLAVRWS